jgi:hypothetical protein
MPCYVLDRVFVCSRHGQQISIKSWTNSLGCSYTSTQVSSENQRLYDCYHSKDLITTSYTNSDFQLDRDSQISTL